MPPHVSTLKAEEIERLTKTMADQGLLVAAGWVACCAMLTDESTPKKTVEKLRTAYFSGCQHIFAGIFGSLDEGEDATPADEARLEMLQAELDAWAKTIKQSHN